MTAILHARYPNDFVYAFPGSFKPAALTDNCIGAFVFGKKGGETDAQAAKRCWWNRAPGAANDTSIRHRAWPGGYPTFGANYATFREDTPLVTGVPDFGADGGCVFAICRCDDDTVGSDASHRGSIVGTFGGNTNRGFNMEYASDTTSTARVIDYRASDDTSDSNQDDFGVSTSDFEKIRVLYGETGRVSGGDQLLAMVNLSGDGTTPDPADTTLTDGRSPGSQNFSIGGRISDSLVGYTGSVTKDIAAVLIFNALPDSGQRAALYAQMQAIMSDMSITELSSSW